MPTLLTVGAALNGTQTLGSGTAYNTTTATVYLGGTVNVLNNSTLNLNPVAAVGAATTFNVSNGAQINYAPAVGVSAANTFHIGSNGTLALGPNIGVSALNSIDFTSSAAGPGGTLIVPDSLISANVITSINGFGNSDALQVSNVDGSISSVDYNNGQLQFLDADGEVVSTIQLGLDGNVDPDKFSLSTNANGSINVVACYLRGTRIATDHGEIAIEDIRIGDNVATVSGAFRPVKWIGRRNYSSTYAAKNAEVQPVMFARGSIDDNVPTRDLYVSPQHAMFLDGVLVDAELLINEHTIRRVTTEEAVEYFNIEFDTHDVIIAEGAASESFLNRDCRTMFQNAAEYDGLYPGETPAEMVFYARRVVDGFTLQAVRERLNARAGQASGTAAVGVLDGVLDYADWTRISGWARDRGNLDRPVTLEVLVDHEVVARVIANRYREDLEKAGLGDGRCGFQIDLPTALSPHAHHSIEVRREADGQPLCGAPVLLEAVPEMEAGLRALANVFSGSEAADPAKLDEIAQLLMRSMDMVMQAQARAEGEEHARTTRFHARGEVMALNSGIKMV